MYLLNRRLGGLQNRSEGTGEHKNHLLFSGLEIWIVQTAALPLYWLSYPGSFCYSVWHSNIVRTKITDTRLLHLYKKKYRGICFHAIKEVWDQFSISSSSSITNFGDLCLSCKCRYFTDPTLLCVRVISFFSFKKRSPLFLSPYLEFLCCAPFPLPMDVPFLLSANPSLWSFVKWSLPHHLHSIRSHYTNILLYITSTI